MKNRRFLAPLGLCVLLCNGLPLLAHADTSASNSVWIAPSASDDPYMEETQNPYPEETGAWTTLLRAVNETLLEVWSLQQEKELSAATADQLRTTQTAIETTRQLAEQQLVTLQEDAKNQMPDAKWRISRIETAQRAAQTAIDQLKECQTNITQIKAEPRWATQWGDLVTALDAASSSAQAFHHLFILPMTGAELKAFNQKNEEDFARIQAQIKDKRAKDAENLRANQQLFADMTKRMKEAPKNGDTTQRKLDKLWKKIQPMDYL